VCGLQCFFSFVNLQIATELDLLGQCYGQCTNRMTFFFSIICSILDGVDFEETCYPASL
jgi:hypothetical protein